MLYFSDDQLKQALLDSFGPKPYLVTNPRNLSVSSLDQLFITMFNFGSRKQFKQLESQLGIKTFASIFRKLDSMPCASILPMTSNYLRLYFDRNSPQ